MEQQIDLKSMLFRPFISPFLVNFNTLASTVTDISRRSQSSVGNFNENLFHDLHLFCVLEDVRAPFSAAKWTLTFSYKTQATTVWSLAKMGAVPDSRPRRNNEK